MNDFSLLFNGGNSNFTEILCHCNIPLIFKFYYSKKKKKVARSKFSKENRF